jgi:uncharacterized protein
MKVRKRHCLLAGLLTTLLAGCGSLPKSSTAPSTEPEEHRIMTWVSLRDRYSVKQRYDFSCGSSAMATLLHYYYGEDIGEVDILKDVFEHLDKEAINNRTQEGFSMLDLKRFAERRGYQALGVKLKSSALPKLRGPVLVYLESADFRHFALLRGVREDRVYLADPSRGNIRMSIFRFLEEWPGYTLVINKPGFDLPEEYPGSISEEIPIRQEFNAVRNGLNRGQSNDFQYQTLVY